MFASEPQPGVSDLESEYLLSQKYENFEKTIQAFLYAVSKQPLLDGRCFHTPRPGSSSAPDIGRRVIGVAKSLCRIYLWCKDAFPTSRLKGVWVADVWREACKKTGVNCDSFIQHELFPDNSMGLFLETKMGLRDSVEKSYEFDLDPNHFGPDRKCRNADLASRLLRDRAFVYLDYDRVHHYPYRHPMIQRAINITWFRSVFDVGLRFRKYFSPLSVSAIAFILTAIECCIDEWSDGSLRETNWEEERLKSVYQAHIDSLHAFRQRGVYVFENFRSTLCEEAFKHAGVPSADLRIFISNPVDTARRWGANVDRLGSGVELTLYTLKCIVESPKRNPDSSAVSSANYTQDED